MNSYNYLTEQKNKSLYFWKSFTQDLSPDFQCFNREQIYSLTIMIKKTELENNEKNAQAFRTTCLILYFKRTGCASTDVQCSAAFQVCMQIVTFTLQNISAILNSFKTLPSFRSVRSRHAPSSIF